MFVVIDSSGMYHAFSTPPKKVTITKDDKEYYFWKAANEGVRLFADINKELIIAKSAPECLNMTPNDAPIEVLWTIKSK